MKLLVTSMPSKQIEPFLLDFDLKNMEQQDDHLVMEQENLGSSPNPDTYDYNPE